MPLARTARPDDASTGSLRNCTTLPAIAPKLHEDGEGGWSDIELLFEGRSLSFLFIKRTIYELSIISEDGRYKG